MAIENKNASAQLLPLRGSRKSGERGATMVEFAFTFVVLFILLFGMIDFARALYAYHFISEAAREATRFASVRGDLCSASVNDCPASGGEIRTFVDGLVPPGISASPAVLHVIPTWTNPNTLPICGSQQKYPGCGVQVKVIYDFNFIFPIDFYNSSPVNFSATTIPMSSTSEMVIAR